MNEYRCPNRCGRLLRSGPDVSYTTYVPGSEQPSRIEIPHPKCPECGEVMAVDGQRRHQS